MCHVLKILSYITNNLADVIIFEWHFVPVDQDFVIAKRLVYLSCLSHQGLDGNAKTHKSFI